MLYNAVLLDIQNVPGSQNDLAMGFIDDVVYGTEGTSAVDNVRRLKKLLSYAEDWREEHGAQFEASKYILVHFTCNKYKSTKAAIITEDGTKVKPSESGKYLGVIFDKELRFKAHQQYAVKKGIAAALALASIGKSTWGAPYKYIRQLFQATVATRLDYAAII
jgi:hypothetical protein